MSIFNCPGAGLHERGYSQAARAGTDILQTSFLLLLIGLLFTGCASVPKDYPRSAAINTEAGLYVESPELAQQVIEYMDEGVQPETTFGQRFMSGFIMILPVAHQL